MRTTSHPVEDIDEGCFWLYNYNLLPRGRSKTDVEGVLHIVRWDGKNNVESWYAPGARVVQTIHEVTVTKDFVIFVELGHAAEPSQYRRAPSHLHAHAL